MTNDVDGRVFRTASRYPKMPKIDEVPSHEREALGYMLKRIDEGFNLNEDEPVLVDGEVFGKQAFMAIAASPELGALLAKMGPVLMRLQDTPGTFSGKDHEMIDMVLAFDSNYLAFVASHIPKAIGAGVRIECVEALRYGCDYKLTPDELLQVTFIRAVRDGRMNDRIWNDMCERMGTERGVVDFTFFVCNLLFHIRYYRACGVPEMRPEDLDILIDDYKSGRRSVEQAAAEYEAMKANWKART